MKTLITLLVNILILQPLAAQISENYCNSILESGIYNNYKYFSSIEYDQMLVSHFCETVNSASTESAFAGLTASLPISEINQVFDISGSLGWNEKKARYQQICTNEEFKERFRSIIRREENSIDQGIVNAWTQCVSDNNWNSNSDLIVKQVNSVGASWDKFTVTLINRSDRGVYKIKGVEPNIIRCYTSLDGKVVDVLDKKVKITNRTQTFTGEKNPLYSGQPINITFTTTVGGSTSVRIPGDEDTFGRLEKAMLINKDNIDDLINSLKSHSKTFTADYGDDFIRTRLDNLSKNEENVYVETITAGNLSKIMRHCPNGYYVAGIIENNADGGKFCTSCISYVNLICRPLPIPENVGREEVILINLNN